MMIRLVKRLLLGLGGGGRGVQGFGFGIGQGYVDLASVVLSRCLAVRLGLVFCLFGLLLDHFTVGLDQGGIRV